MFTCISDLKKNYNNTNVLCNSFSNFQKQPVHVFKHIEEDALNLTIHWSKIRRIQESGRSPHLPNIQSPIFVHCRTLTIKDHHISIQVSCSTYSHCSNVFHCAHHCTFPTRVSLSTNSKNETESTIRIPFQNSSSNSMKTAASLSISFSFNKR